MQIDAQLSLYFKTWSVSEWFYTRKITSLFLNDGQKWQTLLKKKYI